MNGVSIVIPIYNALKEARDCVESIYAAHTSVPFEVIAVDNGSHSDVADWLAEQSKSRTNFKRLRFDEPLGFARAMNEGVRQARGDYIALLNSDTLVTVGWLDILASAIGKDPALGIVSPVTNRCGHDVQRDPDALLLSPEDAPRYAASIRDRAEVSEEPQRLVFFCVLVRRTLWDQLAGLDESFRTGNFEDDDFCLRARLAGYRMAVARNAFVYHAERRTFDANRLNHGETLANNQALFAARASRWSRALRPLIPDAARADALSVIVPVTAVRASGLRDSLASLANQTVRGFETVVVSPADLDLSPILSEFSSRLRLRAVGVEEAEAIAPLLNAGLRAASGTEIAYLPSADIYYPFHLEVLLQAGGCAFSAWNVGAERRTPVMFPDAEPGVELGDWAPLLCWLHRRDPRLSFDPSFGVFAPWAFTIQLRDALNPRYLCRVTCERAPDEPSLSDASEAERVMRRFPVANAWQESQRAQFLEGVRQGNWEDRLVVQRNDRARRARRLLSRAQADTKELANLRARLEVVTARTPACNTPAKPDILLFSIIEWTALTQRPHHFATGLVARGHRVFWIDVRLRAPEGTDSANLVREIQPGIFQMDLPAHAGEIYRMEWRPEILETMLACFAQIRAVFGIATAWQLVNFPRWEPLVTKLTEKFGWPVVYDCLDDQQAFASLYGHDLAQFETTLLKTSAKVVASGHTLLEKMRALRPDSVFIPNAADFERFGHAKSSGLLDHLPRPIAGFFGAFADWLDFDWIDAAARRFPAWSFVYIGREGFAKPAARERWKRVTDKPNIHVYPQATQETLAQYLAQMDVCIMPFQDLPVTRSMNAVKLYEYLAAGKPVVAPGYYETNPISGLIATYQSQEESFHLLETAIGSNPQAARARREFAAQNTWSHRLDALCATLGL